MSRTQRPEVVAITGAAAGVGRAAAVAFARRGARIGLIARGGPGMDGLEGAKQDVEAAGGQAVILPADVADATQVEAAAVKLEEAFGPIDVWVNVAMASVFSPFKEMTADEFKRTTEVTYLGQVYGTMAALRRMIPRNQGSIVLVGSALAYRSIPLQSAYCGAKSGIRGFIDSVRCELIHDGSNIRICMVQMPALNTPQFSWVKSRLSNNPQPVPPIFLPEVAAEAIYFAAHHKRRELYVGFSTIKACVANMLAPGLLDVYLARTGYQAQQTGQPANPNRPHNLWEALPGDHGAEGTFGSRSRSRSPALWLVEHQEQVALAGAAGIAVACMLVARKLR
ncbi:MAG TPA: SDR family oxidoreductase [Chloroflexota bacterium]|nr:SDR family oxidoreductase [Chloroflexota bacterium]